jgi:CheY-like chemotaxis protein
VEDNIVNQKLAMRMIEKFGFQVDAASNGKEALKTLEGFRYDVVLMDIQMPELDGFDTTKIIRDAQSKVLDHHVPIIALTAHAMKGDKEECLKAGMNDYISKPIQPHEMLTVIERQISTQDVDFDG